MKKRIVYIDNFLSEHGSTPTTGVTLTQLFINEGYKVVRAGTQKNKAARLFEMLGAILKNKDAVILIATYSTNAFFFAWAGAQLCRLIRVQYIPCLHGGNLPERVKKSPVLCAQIFAHSFTNVVVSGYLQDCISKKNWPSTLIPNSIDISAYPFLLRSSARPRLLWVRSFHKIYNPCLAIKIIHELSKKYNDVSLTMVGPDKDGSLDECKKLARQLKVDHLITFTGRLSRDEWADLSTKHDIFINTTNFDNLPVSIIEAMALGMPVISTNVGGLKYLIDNGSNGILVNPESVEEFVLAVLSLLNDDKVTCALSTMARQTAEKYDVTHVMQLWHELLDGA